MSSHKSISFIFLLLIIFLSGCSQKKIHVAKEHKFYEKEDLYILHALELKQSKKSLQSKILYLKLFKKTNKLEYLREYMRLALQLSYFTQLIGIYNENKDFLGKEYEFITRSYITALIAKNKKAKALSEAKILLEYNENALNYEILANAYFINKDYENAKDAFEESFELSDNPEMLIKIFDILYTYLDEQDDAIDILEDYNEDKNVNLLISDKLLRIYQERKDIDNIIKTLRSSANKFKEQENFVAYAKVANLLLIYLEKKDVYLAIEFLEENNISQLKLFNLYKRTNQRQKALDLVKEVYSKNNNIELLGQIAILEFEIADNKKEVIGDIVKKLKNVTSVIDSHFYQNFLGYLLIDFEIDIKNGMKLVQKALKKQANNIAYIDSLAWGYYKLGDCKEAYKNMKQVVDEIGLKDQEIIQHWKIIKECKTK